MKKLYKVALLLITIVVISCLSTFEIFAYANHQPLITGSFDILADEQEDANQFYSECFYSNKNFMSIIIENSNKPDASSADGGESIDGTHYYVYEGTPSTIGQYYKNRLSHYGISARTRFKDHYGNAINCYKNGDYNNAMQSLGRAIHYLQDIGCTPHSTGLEYINILGFLSPHARFENYIDANIASFITEAKQNHVANYGATDFGDYDLYLSSYEEICNSLAEYSSSTEYDNIDFKTIVLSSDQNSSEYRNAALGNVSKTLSYIAGLLYKFYYDVEIKNSCYEIKSGSTYFIKHVETGKYLYIEDINNVDVTLDDFDGSTNQQFELTHDNVLGAFQISSIAYPSQKIIIETSNYTLQHSSTTPESFKIIYDGYEHYRIASKTNESSINNSSYNYTRYLKKMSSSDSVNCPSSDPTISGILWDFIEIINHEDSSTTYVSKSNKKVLSYSPTVVSNHPFYIVSSHDINVNVFDCTLGSSSNYTQNTINQCIFTNGNQYLISISFQNSYYEGYVICYNNSNIIDYYEGLEVNLPVGGSQLICFYPPTTNEYIIETSQDVVMQIYEQSAAEVCMIYNSEESQVVYSQTLHQFDTNCSYYIRLFNPSEATEITTNLSIVCLSDEFVVASSKTIELTSAETKIYKIDLPVTDMMTLYTTNRDVTLQLYELINNNLILICDNEDDGCINSLNRGNKRRKVILLVYNIKHLTNN